MTMKVHRDLRPLVEAALGAGWEVTKTGSGHLRFKSPTGALVFTGSTPSDHRAVENVRALLRNAGLALPKHRG